LRPDRHGSLDRRLGLLPELLLPAQLPLLKLLLQLNLLPLPLEDFNLPLLALFQKPLLLPEDLLLPGLRAGDLLPFLLLSRD
jgi:hypothetical protein